MALDKGAALSAIQVAVNEELAKLGTGQWKTLSPEEREVISGATAHRAGLLLRRLKGEVDDTTYEEQLLMDRAAFAAIGAAKASQAYSEWNTAFWGVVTRVLKIGLSII